MIHHDFNSVPYQQQQYEHQQLWIPRSSNVNENISRNLRVFAPVSNTSDPVSAFHRSFYAPSSSNDHADPPIMIFDEHFTVIPSSPTTTHSVSTDSTENQITADQITANDVLCGRGAGANTHSGNIKFRSLVGDFQHAYLSAKPLDKANIAKGIVAKITEQGGRFLKRSEEKGPDGKVRYWYDIGYKAAREKTCQALRERAPSTFDLPNQVAIQTSNLIPDLPSGGSLDDDGAVQVNDCDVLLGRGGVTNSHLGNKKYRTLVRKRQREYLAAPKLKKAGIAQQIVDEVFNDGGRFLTERKGDWVEISKDKAREKTSQALREKAPELRRIYDVAQELVAKRVAEKVAERKRAERNSCQNYMLANGFHSV